VICWPCCASVKPKEMWTIKTMNCFCQDVYFAEIMIVIWGTSTTWVLGFTEDNFVRLTRCYWNFRTWRLWYWDAIMLKFEIKSCLFVFSCIWYYKGFNLFFSWSCQNCSAYCCEVFEMCSVKWSSPFLLLTIGLFFALQINIFKSY